MQNDVRPVGRIVRWVADRGFGFIRPSVNGPDVFTHVSEFSEGHVPAEGQLVRYEIETRARGLRGVRVTVQ